MSDKDLGASSKLFGCNEMFGWPLSLFFFAAKFSTEKPVYGVDVYHRTEYLISVPLPN